MVSIEKLNCEAVSFDSWNFDFEKFGFEVESWKNAAEKRILNNAAKTFHLAVVVAYTNFSSDSAIEVGDNSVEVLWILEYYRETGLWIFVDYQLLKNLSFDRGFAKKNPSRAVIFDFFENR